MSSADREPRPAAAPDGAARPGGEDPLDYTRLVSGLTHALRTPLGSVMMLAELLAQEDDERARRYAEKIRQATAEMRDLLAAAAELNRAESGRLALAAEEVAVARLAERLAERLTEIGGDRLPVAVAVAAGAPATVRTDAGRVVQIAAAVAEEALARPGATGLALRFERPQPEGADGGALLLTITVQGAGPGFTADAFTPFSPAAAGGAAGGGQQLRLPLARAVARRLGGDLTVAGAAGEAARFALRLPAAGPPSGRG